MSESGRAPKNDPAIFALALCVTLGDAETKRAAKEALPRVCRIGTHLFHFAQYVDGMRGWGRGLREAVAAWYAMPAAKLALQGVKYGQRDGWAHRDLLRLAHPKPPTEQHETIYGWMVRGWEWVGDEPHPDEALRILWAAERAKRARSAGEVISLVEEYGLPREAIPTEWLNSKDVWAALLAVAGAAIAGYLTVVHFADQPIVCSSIGDCEYVNSSEYAKLAGVPVAVMGLAAYAALFALAVAAWLRRDASLVLLAWGGALAGFGFSMYLTYIELYVLDAICLWCVASASVMTALFAALSVAAWLERDGDAIELDPVAV